MQEVKVRIEAIGDVTVLVNVSEKKALVSDGYELGFHGSGHIDKDGKLWSNTNDITTNYLEVAMVKAFQHLGVKVNDIHPHPINRKIEVVK